MKRRVSDRSVGSIGSASFTLALLLTAAGLSALAADDPFADWHVPEGWYRASDARLDPWNEKHLYGERGEGVLINGRVGKASSLITRRRDYRDVEVHVEFMIARHSNSGVIFHGNHEIQIRDTSGVKKPAAGDCGGIYPRAEGQPGTPSYHHLDGGSAPRINAAKPAGQWQTLDILFKAARFDANGKKTANAQFVRVVHNGVVIQENVEVPWASGPNWDRKQYPQGPIILQGDYGPVAFRNVHIRELRPDEDLSTRLLNEPPPGFIALFNGRDLTGWRVHPLVKQYWRIDDGILKSPDLIDNWGASLTTEKQFRDFVLMADFRMPTISDSGISFRRLIPKIPGFGTQEQFNLRSRGGMGHLESYYFLPKEVAEQHGLKESEKPHVRHIDPEVGVWHTVRITLQGRTMTTEYDGEVLLDHFRYHDWMLSMDPAPISLQKHKVVHGDNLGAENPCPIEYRNVFLQELGSGAQDAAVAARNRTKTPTQGAGGELAELLRRIDATPLPEAYDPRHHQDYVDRRLAKLTEAQRSRINRLWQVKQRLDPDMPNRGFSFVRIMEYVATGGKRPGTPARR